MDAVHSVELPVRVHAGGYRGFNERGLCRPTISSDDRVKYMTLDVIRDSLISQIWAFTQPCAPTAEGKRGSMARPHAERDSV